MYEQIHSQVIALSKNFADTAFKAHSLAVEGFERITDLNLKTLENHMAATVGFWSEATEVRDFDGFKAIWPKSVSLVKESSEKLYATSQEVLGVTLKTNEAIGQLAKGAFDAANEAAHKHANTIQANVKKATTATK